MSFGTQWGFGADEKTSHQVLDAYRAAGGNFLDTANKYHGGETEEIVGRWLEGKRDDMVVATKYTLSMQSENPNASGNHRRNLVRSVEASLKRLRTDWIDLLWVHAWDRHTPFEETMRALDDLVRSGKVLYLGISDAPSWIVSASNVLADLRGWTAFVGLQIEYSLLERTVERELLPMARAFDLSVLAWAPLGGGVLTGKYTKPNADASASATATATATGTGTAKGPADDESLRRQGNIDRGRTAPRALEIARAVDEVARSIGATSAQVATAWVAAQGYGMIPIVGARKVSQIEDTIAATQVRLEPPHLEKLDAVSRVDLGFPLQFLGNPTVLDLVYSGARARVDGRPQRF